jgi:hypothetical protein
MRDEKELTGKQKKELLELLAEARKKFRLETKAAESREAAERDVELARQLVPSEEVGGKLLRYERAMDRKLHAAVAQLERLQRHRRGTTLLPPTQ